MDQSLSEEEIDSTEFATGNGSLATTDQSSSPSGTMDTRTNPTFAGGTVGGDRPGTFGSEDGDEADDDEDNREPPICRA